MAWIVRRKLKRGLRYYVRYSLDGRVQWFSAGGNLAIARKARSKLETEIAEGRFLDRKERSDWTLRELFDLYLRRFAELRPKSARWRRERVRQILRTLDPETALEAVTPETLDRYAEARLRAGRASSTVLGEIAVLRHALRQAVRWKAETRLSVYRLADWSPPRARAGRAPVFLQVEEVARLLHAARERALRIPGSDRAEVLLRLALATGARVGELCAIRRGDLERGRLRIRASKGGRDASVTLDDALAEDLGRLLEASAVPFAGASEARARFRRFWHGVRKAAGLERVRFHDLRHTFASEFLRRGGTLRELQERLGHRTGRMTERYSHFAESTDAPDALTWPSMKPPNGPEVFEVDGKFYARSINGDGFTRATVGPDGRTRVVWPEEKIPGLPSPAVVRSQARPPRRVLPFSPTSGKRPTRRNRPVS